MTLEKTVFLSVIFHAVLLTVLSLTLEKQSVVLPDFNVNLVSPSGESVAKGEALTVPPPQATKKASRPSPLDSGENLKSSMVVHPYKTSRLKQQSLIRAALAQVRSAHARDEKMDTEINNALEKAEGIADVESRIVKLRKTLDINVKNKTAKPSESAAPAGTPDGGDAALSSYSSMVAAKIKENWFFADFKTNVVQAVISIMIMKDGTVVAKGFDKHSGNGILDESAMRAVQRTGKVPPPPGGPIEIAVRFTPN